MSTTPRGPKEEMRNLSDLVDHPLQSMFFDNLSDDDQKRLAADIKRNGLREKIHVLPRNKAGLKPDTIIDGHQRRRALQMNGEKTTTVVLRYDLAEVDAATLERSFLEPNQNRRQLDPLAKARVALRLFEIEKKRPRGQLRQFEFAEARDRVGKAIGMSGRNLNRYFRILRTPLEVQNAFRAGELSLIVAEKVCDLDAKVQSQIAERIKGSEDPKSVVTKVVGNNKGKQKRPNDAFASFRRDLIRALSDLDGRHDQISGHNLDDARPELKKAKALINQLLAKPYGNGCDERINRLVAKFHGNDAKNDAHTQNP